MAHAGTAVSQPFNLVFIGMYHVGKPHIFPCPTNRFGILNRTLAEHGSVSEPVVREMAEGTLRLSGADISVAVSGVAGPDGGSDEKPVGTVWFSWAMRGPRGISIDTVLQRFEGNRESIRMQSVIQGLKGVRARLPT